MSIKRKITCLDMEVAVSKLFPIRRHVIVPNVSWGLLSHEADLAILRPTGVLLEIEIKVSFADFKKDFQKKHKHEDYGNRITKFYYAIPIELLEKCLPLMPESAGIITVHRYNNIEYNYDKTYAKFERSAKKIKNSRKLTNTEQFQFMRLGCMRIIPLKGKILKLKYDE